MLRAVAAVDRRLVRPGTAHRLAAVRTGLSLAIAFRLVSTHWWEAARAPTAGLDPVFAVQWIGQVPPVSVLVLLQAIGLAAALAAAMGRRSSVAFVVAWTSYVVLGGLWSSAGKVLHNELLLVLASAPFLFAPSDARLGDRSTSPRWGWPPRAALAVIATVYAVAGLQKLRHGGTAWVTGDNLRWVLLTGSRTERSLLPDLARELASHPWAWHAMAAATVALEVAAPALLWFRRSRRWFAVFVGLLHGGIWLLLGLDYSAWIVCVAVVACLGTPVSRPLRAGASPRRRTAGGSPTRAPAGSRP